MNLYNTLAQLQNILEQLQKYLQRVFYAKIAYLWTGSKKKPCAIIAQWVRLRLPSCCPGFESKAHHLSLYHL